MTVSSSTTRPTTNTPQTSSSSGGQQRHTVKKDENLWSIAQQHSAGKSNADVARYHQDLIRANPQIKDPNVIRPGQELNLPSAANAGATGGSRIKPATSDPAARFESSSSAPEPQTARPDPNAANATHPPVSQDLSDEVTARRHAANTNPAGRARGGRAASPEEEEQELADAQGGTGANGADGASDHKSVMGTPNLTRRTLPYANAYGDNIRRGISREGTGGGGVRSHDETQLAQNRGAEQWRHTNSDTTETTPSGQRTRQLQEEAELRNRRTGESLSDSTTVAQDQDGNFGSRTTSNSVDDDGRSEMDRLMEVNGPEAVTATAVLAEHRIAGDDDWHGVATVGTTHTEDRTGGGAEAHALAYRANADAAAAVDLRHGELNVGVNAAVQADLVGASASGQLGTRNSMTGALSGRAEAHVGARAEGGAGVVVSPNNVGVRAGGEAFVGAEVRGTAGYENRYGGVSVTGRGQAGAGVAAGVDVGYRNGVVGFQADLGAAVGLGGRVTVDVNVNVAAIAQDAGRAIGDVAEGAREGVSRAWSAINPFD